MPWNGFGAKPYLPVVTTACAGQIERNRLVSWNAIDWSVVVQIGGQVTAISHTPPERSAGFALRSKRDRFEVASLRANERMQAIRLLRNDAAALYSAAWDGVQQEAARRRLSEDAELFPHIFR